MGFWNKLVGRKEKVVQTVYPPTQTTQHYAQQPQTVIAPSGIKTLHKNIMHSFNRVKEDIDSQNQWISFLHNGHQEIKEKHEGHVQQTKQNLGKINRWVEYLHTNGKKQQKDFEELEKYMKEAIVIYKDHIVELYNKYNELLTETEKTKNHVHTTLASGRQELIEAVKHEMHVEVHDLLKNTIELERNHLEIALTKKIKAKVEEDLKEEFEGHIRRKLKEHKEELQKANEEFHKKTEPRERRIIQEPAIVEHTPMFEQSIVTHAPIYTQRQHLTNPEKKLLNFLFNEGDPLSYQQVSVKTGHSINTIRVNMNLLKKKGFVEENMLPSGVKLFTLKNKEKIKKMHNLEIMH